MLGKLKERKYTYKEINEFKEDVLYNNRRDLEFLLENVSGLRILGWELHCGSRIKHEYMNNFYDVIKFTNQLGPSQVKLIFPKNIRRNYAN